jgi:hypothetical protein
MLRRRLQGRPGAMLAHLKKVATWLAEDTVTRRALRQSTLGRAQRFLEGLLLRFEDDFSSR